jgi:ParB-like chromosome segregation protein Spo0J
VSVVEIRLMRLADLNPAPYNPRRRLRPGDREFERLKASLREFGLVEPLIWNKRTGNLVGGHQRLSVLLDIGETEADVSVVDLGEAKEKALNLALNRVQGEWDQRALNDLLKELEPAEVLLAGFSAQEAGRLDTIASQAAGKPMPAWEGRYEVVTECESEEDAEALFERLKTEGHRCRVLIL